MLPAGVSRGTVFPPRRASPLISPARRGLGALELIDAAVATRQNDGESPARLSYESLLNRPRSNQRERTPMRYESPLTSGAFRREAIASEQGGSSAPLVVANPEGQRITIRPLAGRAVGANVPGVVVARRVQEENRSTTPLSRKQGPSHRKVRRWNNENFNRLASELANAKGNKAAEALFYGQVDAHQYRSILNPEEHKSQYLAHFMDDDRFKELREKFFRGEIGLSSTADYQPRVRKATQMAALTPQAMMNRVDRRLKQVVIRAFANSAAASSVLEKFEHYLIEAFVGNDDDGELLFKPDEWDDILLEPPTVTQRKDSKQRTATFFFHAEAPAGGFNRLLLRALCQFHGLATVSSSANVAMGGQSQARVLTATGIIVEDGYRLTKYLESIESATDQ